jgi:hypothetical protein
MERFAKLKLIPAPPASHNLHPVPSRLWDELQSVCVRGRNAVPAKEGRNVPMPSRACRPGPGGTTAPAPEAVTEVGFTNFRIKTPGGFRKDAAWGAGKRP